MTNRTMTETQKWVKAKGDEICRLAIEFMAHMKTEDASIAKVVMGDGNSKPMVMVTIEFTDDFESIKEPKTSCLN